MTKARDIMHEGVECVAFSETLTTAARKMRDLHVGALPICGEDNRLKGIITDRDIVVRCLAEGGDPQTVTAGQLAQGTPVWIDSDAEEDEVLNLMEVHKIRRLPVLDQNHRLVGMISERDIAINLPQQQVGEFAESVYSGSPTL